MRNSPFRQEGRGTGRRIATASVRTGLAMTGGFTWGAVGHMGPALQPHIFVGQGPCALPWVRYGIGGRTESSAPTEAQQKVQWAGDRKGRPYGGLQAVQGAGRCGHRPLRVHNKRCGERIPPLGKGAGGRGDGLPRPVCALTSQ